MCFVDWSPKLFAFFGHCLRRGGYRLPRDVHSSYGSSLLIFGFHVLALKERLSQPRLSGSFDELHLYRVAYGNTITDVAESN